MIKKHLFIFMGLMLILFMPIQSRELQRDDVQIRIVASEKVVRATLNRSQAAQDFIAMLPLTLTLNDYGTNEKVSDLPKKLSLEGSPSGYTPQKGDLAHYAPWGNFVVFRHTFSYSNSLIKLGEINEGLDILDHSGPIYVSIDVVVQ